MFSGPFAPGRESMRPRTRRPRLAADVSKPLARRGSAGRGPRTAAAPPGTMHLRGDPSVGHGLVSGEPGDRGPVDSGPVDSEPVGREPVGRELVGHEHGDGHVLEDMTRHAAEEILPQAGVAVGAHDQHVGPVLGAVIHDRLADTLAAGG